MSLELDAMSRFSSPHGRGTAVHSGAMLRVRRTCSCAVGSRVARFGTELVDIAAMPSWIERQERARGSMCAIRGGQARRTSGEMRKAGQWSTERFATMDMR